MQIQKPIPIVQPDSRYVLLDFVRGVSAILVCAGHLRAALLQDYGQIQTSNLLQKIFYFSTGLGHQAVIVFFVLSGFFVGGSVIKAGQKFNISKYAVARLSRLWIVLVPALVITAIVDDFIYRYQPEVLHGIFYAQWCSGPRALDYSNSIETFFANLFFLQTIAAPVFGSNGPLWSLANEFWYYVIFPLLFLVVDISSPKNNKIRKIFFLILLVFIILLLPIGLIQGFFIWLLGVFVFIASRFVEKKRRYALLAIGFAIFFFTLIYSKMGAWQLLIGLNSDFAVGAGFTLLCFILANWSTDFRSGTKYYFSVFSKVISDSSYSLYLIHFPFVILFASVKSNGTSLAPNKDSLVIYFCVLIALFLVSALFYNLFEKNTKKTRQLISKLLKIG